MKKLLVMLTLLCVALLPFAVMAETATETITWDEVGAPMAEAAGIEGDFYAMEELNLAIWLPDELNEVEITEEDAAEGILSVLTDEEGSCALIITCVNQEGITLEELLASAIEDGMKEPELVNINGLDALCYTDAENNAGCIALVYTDGDVVIFSFTPIDVEGADVIFGLIMSSLMPLE